MNKKAFTLVELMGVITVFGLITLLIAPTIINQIRNSKTKIDNVTEKLIYSATELYLDNKKNDYPKNDGSTYCLTLKDLVEDGKLSSPIINSNGDEISLDSIIAIDVTDNGYSYRMPSSCESVYIDEIKTLSELATISSELGVTSVHACATSGTCEPGTAFAIKVNDTTTYKFYVIEDNNSKVTLIMDRNLGNTVAWYETSENNRFGPITALNYLNNQTSVWDNIEPIEEYTYDNNLNGTTNTYGYQKLEIKNGIGKLTSQDGKLITELEGTSRARLITYEEVTEIKTSNSNTIPTYLYTNLSSSNTIEAPYGYWCLTADSSLNDAAFEIAFHGLMANRFVSYGDNLDGVRPVIELTK